MSYRAKKFLSFYRPYLGTLALDLLCAFIISAITLILPLCVRYITQNLLDAGAPGLHIYTMNKADASEAIWTALDLA